MKIGLEMAMKNEMITMNNNNNIDKKTYFRITIRSSADDGTLNKKKNTMRVEKKQCLPFLKGRHNNILNRSFRNNMNV